MLRFAESLSDGERADLARALEPILARFEDDVVSESTAPRPGVAGLDAGVLAIAGVVVLGAVMSILDTTIVNVAIDALSREFHTTLSTIQWVSTGYMLALATVIPLTGWAADRFGTKRLYIVSIVLFLAGSALSGMAWSAGSLIAFRVLQGLGGGMIMPAGMTIMTRAAGPTRVGRVMSIVGVPMLLGPVLGPILGGWLVDDISWRWIFYVNLPIGARGAGARGHRSCRATSRSRARSSTRSGSRCSPPAWRCSSTGCRRRRPRAASARSRCGCRSSPARSLIVSFVAPRAADDAAADRRCACSTTRPCARRR